MFVSFVIPTLNSERTLEACLQAIAAQEYPRERYEIVVADAGSSDRTREIATRCGVDRIVPNELKTGEAGKTAGIKAARGELIALIDSDNILPDPAWLRRMVAPFKEPQVVASEPLSYSYRRSDPILTRYFALLGMNDPICLFTGNYDRYSAITGRWTGLQVASEDRGDYLLLDLTPEALPTIGANGFILRRSLLEHVNWEPYFFDIDVVHQAVVAGYNRMAKVKVGIVHLYCERLADFSRKQRRRIRDFLYYAGTRQRTYPWQQQSRRGIIKFVVATLLLWPLLWQAWRGYRRQPDRAWRYHLPVCWLTLSIYGIATLRRMTGLRQAPVSRTEWQQRERADNDCS